MNLTTVTPNRSIFVLFLLSIFLISFAYVSQAEQTHTPLSTQALNGINGVISFEMSSDERFVVYEVEQKEPRTRYLYRTNITAAADPELIAADLNVAYVPDVFYRISPDNQWIVYFSNGNIYKAPGDGGIPIKMNDTGVNVEVNEEGEWKETELFKFTPDGSHVVYKGHTGDKSKPELYVSPLALTEGDSQNLTGGKEVFGLIDQFFITADSSHLIFASGSVITETGETKIESTDLYSVSLDGGELIKLDEPGNGKGEILNLHIHPDNQSVFYVSNVKARNFYQLFQAPIDGQTPAAVINKEPNSTTAELYHWFDLSHDGKYLVYWNWTLFGLDLLNASPNETYVIDLESGDQLDLNPILPENAFLNDVHLSPDGSTLVLEIFQESKSLIYIFDLKTNELTLVLDRNMTLLPELFEMEWRDFEISPDGQFLVFTVYFSHRGDLSLPYEYHLYSVRLLDQAIFHLTDGLGTAEGSMAFDISQSGERVVFHAYPNHWTNIELFSNSITGNSLTQVSLPLDSQQVWIGVAKWADFKILSDNRGVLYLAQTEQNLFAETDEVLYFSTFADVPYFTSEPVVVARPNAVYNYLILTENPFGTEPPIISAVSLPAWLELVDNGDGTATLSGTPTSDDIGPQTIQIRVANDQGSTSDQIYYLFVGDSEVKQLFIPFVQKLPWE